MVCESVKRAHDLASYMVYSVCLNCKFADVKHQHDVSGREYNANWNHCSKRDAKKQIVKCNNVSILFTRF